jgi:putative endonuclease
MFYVYVLRSKKDGKRYIGFTRDLERRIDEHKKGMVKSTKHRRPLELVYHEAYEIKSEAMEREKYLKTGNGREWLRISNL